VYDVQWDRVLLDVHSIVGAYIDVIVYCSIELSAASTVRSYNNHKADLPESSQRKDAMYLPCCSCASCRYGMSRTHGSRLVSDIGFLMVQPIA